MSLYLSSRTVKTSRANGIVKNHQSFEMLKQDPVHEFAA